MHFPVSTACSYFKWYVYRVFFFIFRHELKNVKMEAATQMLKRAVELDTSKKYSESKVCYEEGIEMLLKTLTKMSDENAKKMIRLKIDAYMKRAEELKKFVKQLKKDGKFHEKIEIENNQRGCSYGTLFAKYIDDSLTVVEIKDAYIRSHHQILNLLRFCELLLRKAKNLKIINVLTGKGTKNFDFDNQ